MKRTFISWRRTAWILVLTSVIRGACAEPPALIGEEIETASAQAVLSLQALQANWTFSGSVRNENGERYAYFLQIQRDNARFHAMATLMDEQSKAIVIYEESNTLIEQPELTHWQVGNIFLRFNPINNSWVFGVKDKDKKGFNFKADMLTQSEVPAAKQQNLRDGIAFLIRQTGQLNGHIQLGEASQEQFVTARKAWFRQIWVSKLMTDKHRLTSVLCDFANGNALYSVTLPEADALRGTLAGWRDEQGKALTMSQFVSTREGEDATWHIKVSSPKVDLALNNLLDKIAPEHHWILGLTTGVLPGFCAISFDEIEGTPTQTTTS